MCKKYFFYLFILVIVFMLPFGYILAESDGETQDTHKTYINPSEILKIKSQGQEVVNLQMRLRDLGYFNYKVTGYYAEATRGAVALFQEENGLTVDGTVGPETKSVLYSSQAKRHTAMPSRASEFLPASRGGVSSLGVMVDWFSKGQYLFPRGDVAKVTDLYTGKSFMMKRTGGTNHADSEPVSTSDAEAIKSIWGGWSWDRRPVIVEAGGVRIAASMHGMPHAYDRVPNNGMDGHVCIHFYKSRTHIRNKEDADHQAMVRRAAGK
ncbi:MAG: peptidoglycan-binding protein [Clostridiales bacterium]|nr:peptidoglycan-binding protein [Clostridiales bacterium]